ncbi:hypothetical protein CLV79_11194 [Limimaricola soesokkakensis]|uniref:Uncharacterized protein n=1 Tax=Limimaricola soesokkakensis TaxID=1343159 RepID=A0A1X6ZUG5_9RHOB|nr:hypothetical protein CLV79_11194 [Limimaricola soesokkakensis]SLN61735.1 hypothetical protein LOS8367_02991 [Limimaricola soesokkakensis]
MARGGLRGLAGALTSAITLAGCGGGGSEAHLPSSQFDRAAFGRLSALPPATDLPQSGSARYDGGFVADIRQGDVTPSGRIEGGVTIELDFAEVPATLPIRGELHDITGSFLGEDLRIDALEMVPGGGRMVLDRQGGAVAAGFGAELSLAGEARRLDIGLESPLRGARGRALAGPVSGTILTAPFTDQPHVLTGQFHATTD